jgi:hypothetical protein
MRGIPLSGHRTSPANSEATIIPGKETKIFDPADGYSPLTDPMEVTDATLARRGNRWWMFLAGPVKDRAAIQLFSASLPPGAPLSPAGWSLTPDPSDPSRVQILAAQVKSKAWDLNGGRHCPSYVKGWHPQRKAWVERIYYAGAAENLWGPYTIGYLEWDGATWAEQSEPVFLGTEDWEHGSVYEPNLIYADGKWRMWYVAGSNADDYLVQGYSESDDGETNWSEHTIFIPPEERVFDFSVAACVNSCVKKTSAGYEAVFSRVWVAPGAPPEKTGLWWCRSKTPSSNFADWSTPVQIMTAKDCGWHVGPWKPSLQFSETDPAKRLVFFDGLYRTNDPGPFPFAFTSGCLEFEIR